MQKLFALGGGAVAAIFAGVGVLAIALGAVFVGVIGGMSGPIVAALSGGQDAGGDKCAVAGPPTEGGAEGTGEWTGEQIGFARTIIGMGKATGMPERAWLIALMTAMQESTLRNLDGGDRDSQGLFQQRPSMGWGTIAEITDPRHSAQAFFLGATTNPGLASIPNWDTMPLTLAADAVQRSAFPDAYGKWEASARAIISEHGDSAPELSLVRGGTANTSAGGTFTEDDANLCPSDGGVVGAVGLMGDDYPGRSWVPDRGSVAGGLARECVDFTAWRMRQLTEGWDSSNPQYGTWYVLGNGANWGASAAALGYKVDRSPTAGDIAYWGGGFGHVAFVAEVKDGGKIIIEEYNMIIPGGGGASDYSYHVREIDASEPAGFISFIDDPGHPKVPMSHSITHGQEWKK